MRNISISDNRSFISIPIEYYKDPQLSETKIFLLSEIVSLHELGECFASNKHFADFLGCTKNHVSDLIGELVEDGYIECKYKRDPQHEKVEQRVIVPIRKNPNTTTDRVRKNPYANDESVRKNPNGTSDGVRKIPKDKTTYSIKETGSELKTKENDLMKGAIDATYGVPYEINGIPQGDIEKYRNCIYYYIKRYNKLKGENHPRCTTSYWDERIVCIYNECRKKHKEDITEEELRDMVDYKFDKMKHINGMQFATFANPRVIAGILVNLFFKKTKELHWAANKKWQKEHENDWMDGLGENIEPIEEDDYFQDQEYKEEFAELPFD